MHNRQSKNIGRAVSGVVILTLIAKLMGFFREIVLGFFFGATGISDAYLISQNIPGTIFQFVGTGLLTCFIPVYYRVSSEDEDTVEYTNRILSVVFVFSTVVIVFVWLFTQRIVSVFASGFEGETLYYAIWFTRIGVLSLYFSSMIYVYNSYLNANHVFTPTAFAAIPYSLFIMLAIVLGAKINIWLLSIGSLFSVGIQLLFLMPAMRKTGYKFRLYSSLDNSYVKLFFRLMLPVILGVSVNELNALVDRTLASQAAVGGISALTYANSLIQFVQGGIAQPIATVYYPQITEYISAGNHNEAKRSMEKSIELVLGILIPITMGFIIYSYPITKILFEHGVFDETATLLTSTAVKFYSIGICFAALREFLSRYYYANSNTRTPMINASVGVVCNIIFNIVLSKRMGIAGLAIATSISAAITSLLLYKDTRTKTESGILSIRKIEIFKIIVTSALMGCVSFAVYSILPDGGLVSLVLSVLVGILVYVIIGKVLRLEIIDFLIEMLSKVITR